MQTPPPLIDDETVAMLQRQCELMDERAVALAVEVGPDGFVFSLAADCAQPMPPDFLTKRVGELKDHLGIADTKPETIALQTQALKALSPQAPRSSSGRPGYRPERRDVPGRDRRATRPERTLGDAGHPRR